MWHFYLFKQSVYFNKISDWKILFHIFIKLLITRFYLWLSLEHTNIWMSNQWDHNWDSQTFQIWDSQVSNWEYRQK